ncbi:hypothetical protein CISIN_1g038805mg [Citrus sinensis]|uniref:Uncharacterized protein n=1 Tax=Citrus sinensis TaxID=2711 RepID=A0A067GPY5_CITSI|nr:hypothetical protein CISIN_1g038805mg [Citrus sinensis]
MTSTIGWYGPLIDLSQAASHVGDFVVQLIVFVHCSTPVQVWTVGDETLPFFSVSLWQKLLRRQCVAFAGDVVLLQKWVQRTKSALQLLVHNSQVLSDKEGFRFRMDIRVTPNFLTVFICTSACICTMQLSRNWKVPEERKSRDCFSLSEHLVNLGVKKMFFSRRLCRTEDKDLVEDLICTGC